MATASSRRVLPCRLCTSEGNPSRLQREVASALAALELQPREEVRTAQGYSFDTVVRVDGHEVALEVEGRDRAQASPAACGRLAAAGRAIHVLGMGRAQ